MFYSIFQIYLPHNVMLEENLILIRKRRKCPVEAQFACDDMTCVSTVGRCNQKIDCSKDECRMYSFYIYRRMFKNYI